MESKEFFKSKKFKGLLIGFGVAFLAMVIFQTGVMVGLRKASYSNRLGERYFNAFGRQNGRGMPNFMRDDFAGAHGTTGRIVSISLPQIVIEDQEKIEKTILITGQTQIMQFRQAVKPEDLKVDQNVVIFGTPNVQAQIEAKIIRLMPAFPGNQGLTPNPAGSTLPETQNPLPTATIPSTNSSNTNY